MSELPERIPFLSPEPPRLSTLVSELEAIERSGRFSNFGPVSAELEDQVVETIFGGTGQCLAVNNATTGLMIAIREAATPGNGRRFALMPSFTFAATAHAALWAGLTPLFVDIDSTTWLGSEASEEEALARYGEQIACLVPYATFGNCLDLDRYRRQAARIGAGLVIDAAGSLGTVDSHGDAFGKGSPDAVVFSMHVTKVFATAEGGLVYVADGDRLRRLRAMANFGFANDRRAEMAGLNGKLPEVLALLGLSRLRVLDQVADHRAALAGLYRREFGALTTQQVIGVRIAYQFMPVALAGSLAASRDEVVSALADTGIGARTYFSPHLWEQPYFASVCAAVELPNTDDLARRILSLPLSDRMSEEQVEHVCRALWSILDGVP